jgi:hypothetical protein
MTGPAAERIIAFGRATARGRMNHVHRAMLALCLVVACDRTRRVVRVRLPDGHGLQLRALRTLPSSIIPRRLEGRTLTLDMDATAHTLLLPGLCPLAIPAGEAAPQPVSATRLFDLPDSLAQVGYDAAVVLEVRPGCPEAAQGELHWRQVEGEPLAALHSEVRGQRLSFRTLPRAHFFAEASSEGIVAVSPRSQGRVVLEAVANVPGMLTQRQRLTVTSIARATGLSSIAVGQRIMLDDVGYRVTRGLQGSRAAMPSADGMQTFLPEASGRYELTDAQGESLEVQAVRHDHTPMDCARSECHVQISRNALASPMSHAFTLPFAHGAEDATCMLDCHVVGEPGLSDGGFRDVAHELGISLNADLREVDLPPALTRLAGVRCTSCHGPGAVPAHAGRARILRADVCATCHDAPPAYTHVDEWKRSAMARADGDPATREPACAACHTTGGFLNALGVRVRPDLSRDEGVRVGIACAACHAPHGAHVGKRLVRATSLPTTLPNLGAFADKTSVLCAQCHAPSAGEALPSAGAAVLWSGSVKLPEHLGGDALEHDVPHAQDGAGCGGCHGLKATSPSEHGTRTHTDHSFAASRDACGHCHTAPGASDAHLRLKAELAERAAALAARLAPDCGQTPLTAPHRMAAAACRNGAQERARYVLRLVQEDPAAYAHNAGFARILLDWAEAQLASAAP